MKLIGPLFALALAAFASAQKPILTVNAKAGDVLTGVKRFVVKVQAKNPVTQVEFTVGKELRETDPSTPYEFDLDTIAENDGDLLIKFTAYTSEGENASATLTIRIDNGVSKGAGFHLGKAKDALTLSKWDDAITEARIALKADKNSDQARLDLARAYLNKGVLDKAQKYVGEADPNGVEALELSAAIDLRRAFAMRNRTQDDPASAVNAISQALKNAVASRRRSLDKQIDSFGAINDGNRLAFVDLALRGARYSLATEQLIPMFRRDPKNNDAANRLVFAYLRSGRLTEAREALDALKKFGSPDSYGSALEAVYDIQVGADQKSSDAMRDAILSDPDNLGVKSAQAFIALKQGKSQVLAQVARDLASTDSQRTEVNYFIAALDNRLGVSGEETERYFMRSVLIEPTNYDMYIEWGNYSLGLGVSKRLDKKNSDAEVSYANALYSAALTANPSSAQALTGLCLVSMYQGKIDDAVRFGRAAAEAAPQYAAAHYAYSAAATIKAGSIHPLGAPNEAALKKAQDGFTATARHENEAAGKYDPIALQGRAIPNVSQALKYFANGGRTIVMVPPGP